MPKILKQKKLTRIPATIFKYDKKSKFYYVRFWVCKGYKENGCHTLSLKISEERLRILREADDIFIKILVKYKVKPIGIKTTTPVKK